MEINQFKDMVLPPIDDLVQSTNLFLERMPIEVKIPRQDVTPQIRDVTGQRQIYTYASEALTY